MRRTLKLLLLLGIGLALAKDKDGGGLTPGDADNTIDPNTGKPKTDEQRKRDSTYNGTNAQEDFDGVIEAGDKESQDGRAEDIDGDGDPDIPSDTDGDGNPDSESEGGPYATEGDLEGQTDVQIDNPNDPSDTITDIDRIENGVLWEEKSATNAGNPSAWIAKHIDKKFNSYLRAQQYMEGYEDAPIGFNFTESGVDPDFKAQVEARIEQLQAENPEVDIRLDWSDELYLRRR